MSLNTEISLQIFVKKWKIIAVIAAVFVILSYCYASFISKPVYSCSRRYVVVNNIAYSNDAASRAGSVNDVTVSRELAETYRQLLGTNEMMQYLSEELYAQFELDYSYRNLKSFINISRITDTEILQIVVATDDPQLSNVISSAIENILVPFVNNEIGSAEIKTTGRMVPDESTPDVILSCIQGLVFGIVLGVAVVLLKYVTNNKISDREELEKRCEIPVLGVIPDVMSASKGGYGRYGS